MINIYNNVAKILVKNLIETQTPFTVILTYDGFDTTLKQETYEKFPNYITIDVKDKTLEFAETELNIESLWLLIDKVETRYDIVDGSEILAIVVDGYTVFEKPYELEQNEELDDAERSFNAFAKNASWMKKL